MEDYQDEPTTLPKGFQAEKNKTEWPIVFITWAVVICLISIVWYGFMYMLFEIFSG